MSYEEIVKASELLSYRDKLRLAQLLIQLARKEEEDEYPAERVPTEMGNVEMAEYVSERILKSKPSKLPALSNFIGAMFQFQGGISGDDRDRIIELLKERKVLSVSDNGKITYLGG